MSRELKSILSKIIIANKKKSVGVYVSISKKQLGLLECLWSEGLIYGYL